MSLPKTILRSLLRLGSSALPPNRLTRIYPFSALHKRLLSYLKSDYVDLGDRQMFLDPSDSLCLSVYGVYEPVETDFVRSQIKEGSVVVDIGANIGYYTLIFSKLVGEQGRVFAFEPDPDNFALLKRNVDSNNCTNVVLENKAVGDQNGTVTLYLSSENAGDHRMCDPAGERTAVDVECVTLDEYMAGKDQRVDFIKMDIQGAEGQALRGMSCLLQETESLQMITEFWPCGLKRCGTAAGDLLKFLEEKGFKIPTHIREDRGVMPLEDISTLTGMDPDDPKIFTNLFCVKERGRSW